MSADDFGLSVGVNQAIEQAHRDGILSTASLMVAGPAAADAVRLARTLPGLHVGLHLVVIEGHAVRPDLAPVDASGAFGSGQFRLGVDYFFRPAIRRRLAAEIRAQYQAFADTGLRLDHANAHKHMHLHPTVGAMLIRVGREFGLPAVRIPAEPPSVMRRLGVPQGPGALALHRWTGVLRHQVRRAGLRMNDNVFGLAWSGHMTSDRLLRLIPNLPPGVSELYFHPATRRDGHLAALMPAYEHQAEFAALLDPALRNAFGAAAIELGTY